MRNEKNKEEFLAKLVKASAEKALRRDANRTSCTGIFQPQAPARLERFKKGKT